MRGALVAVQIAISLSLLAGAGLLVRSLLEITGAPLGFNPRNVRAKASGLVGMRQRVEPHGGRFYVTSQPGRGTLVRVSVPLRKEPPPVEPETSRAGPPASEGELFG